MRKTQVWTGTEAFTLWMIWNMKRVSGEIERILIEKEKELIHTPRANIHQSWWKEWKIALGLWTWVDCREKQMMIVIADNQNYRKCSDELTWSVWCPQGQRLNWQEKWEAGAISAKERRAQRIEGVQYTLMKPCISVNFQGIGHILLSDEWLFTKQKTTCTCQKPWKSIMQAKIKEQIVLERLFQHPLYFYRWK